MTLFDKKNIKIPEILFDIIIAFLLPIIFQFFVKETLDQYGNIKTSLAHSKIFFFMLYFIIPLYISILLFDYNVFIDKSKIKLIFFIIFSVLSILTLYYSLFLDTVPLVNRLKIVNSGSNFWWYLLGLLLILFATILGIFINKPENDDPEPTPLHMGFILGMILITVIYPLYTIMSQAKNSKSAWPIGVFLFLGGLIIIVLIMNFLFRIRTMDLSGSNFFRFFSFLPKLMHKLILPLFSSATLVIWEAITITHLINAGTKTPTNVFLQLILGGIIPIRLLIAACPPYKGINFIIGIIAIIINVLSIFYYIP